MFVLAAAAGDSIYVHGRIADTITREDVNSVSVTNTWTKSLPSYVMHHLTYCWRSARRDACSRKNKQPKKK